MSDDLTFLGVVTGAVAAGAAVFAKDVGAWYVRRYLQEQDCAYQLAVDILTTLPAVEHVFERTLARKAPTKHDDLVDYPSHWPMRPLALDVRVMVASFEDAELHRDLIVLADRHAAYAECSAEHRKVFDWLLENGAEEWAGTVARERLGTLDSQRARLGTLARGILRSSHACLRRLTLHTKGSFMSKAGRHAKLLALMSERYRLTAEKLEVGEAYYACEQTRERFDPAGEYALVAWAEPGSPVDRLELDLLGAPTSYPSKVKLARQEVCALPLATKIAASRLGARVVKTNLAEAGLRGLPAKNDLVVVG